MPGLYALSRAAAEFPRADCHAYFIVPEGDVERLEALRLLDALRYGDLGSRSMPWKSSLPLSLTAFLRDNRQGRDDLDEVAAHIAPALSARVRFATGTSENLSNLMRRLTKRGPHGDSEPCPLTFHYTQAAVPVNLQSPRAPVPLIWPHCCRSRTLPFARCAMTRMSRVRWTSMSPATWCSSRCLAIAGRTCSR